MTDTERLDRLERIVVILTRDAVDQFSGDAEAEMRVLVDELRGELTVRSLGVRVLAKRG